MDFMMVDVEYNLFIDEHIQEQLNLAIQNEHNEKIVKRFWDKDYTLWNDNPDELSNRLGWLDCIDESISYDNQIKEFLSELKSDGISKILLFGMGGSSLAPEVFSLIFGSESDGLSLSILDTTHPKVIQDKINSFPPNETLYIVSTKSGGTVETLSLAKYFYSQTAKILGVNNAGNHFAAITDPGSELQKIAEKLKFRKTFLNNSEIGGRFSALSLFGLVPAGLIGMDTLDFLNIAKKSESNFRNEDIKNNPAFLVGLLLGVLANNGKNKLTFIIDNELKPFANWIEQLIAESTGKDGKGILPLIHDKVYKNNFYSVDRVFVNITTHKNDLLNHLYESGFPVIQIILKNKKDLFSQIYFWEIATSIIGRSMKIHPFNQPNVESAKILAKEIIVDYKAQNKLVYPEFNFSDGTIDIAGISDGDNLKEIIVTFINRAISKGKSYLGIHSYSSYENDITLKLVEFIDLIEQKYKLPTTLGFGPRFLHSTGQLHKGDSGEGFFIQLIFISEHDIEVSEFDGNYSGITFGILNQAQALGDRQALINTQRNVLTIIVRKDYEKFLTDFINSIN